MNSAITRALLLAISVAACSDRPVSNISEQSASLELEPANVVVDAGQTASVVAYVIDEQGKRVLAKAPAYSVQWSVTDPSVASISANGAVATVTGLGGGAAQIQATVTGAHTLTRSANVSTRPSVVSLRIAAGNHQVAAVSSTLPQQLTVQATNRNGFGVSGALVRFSLRNGAGVIGEQQVTTDDNGFARSTFTLGPIAGLVTIEAETNGVPPVTFDQIAIALPAAFEEYAGNEQQGVEGAPLPSPLGVRVLDATLTPLAGVTVTWSVTSGGGEITSTSVSDNAGVATAYWTLGPAGMQTARASHDNIKTDFRANGVKNQPSKLLKVSGDGQTAVVNTTLKEQLVVRVVDGQGNPKVGIPVAFSVTAGGGSISPTQIATDASGFARATWKLGPVAGLGAVRAAAADIGSLSFSSTAKVEGSSTTDAPSINSLVLTPQSISLTAIGAQSTLTATTLDASGQPVTGQTINFTSSNPSVVTVDNVGRLTAKGVGSALIIASALCCNKADTTAVTVSQQIASLAVTPHNASLVVGGTQTVLASAVDANGNPVTGATVTWSSSNAAVATVAGGAVKAMASGVAYIKAVVGAYKDSAAVSVAAVSAPAPTTPVLTSITLTPGNPLLKVGAQQTFSAVAKDQNGNVMTGQTFSWSSSNTSVMSVSNGVVTALAVGLAALNVSSNGVNASTQVSVTSASAPTQVAGIYAQHDFNDGTLGPFTNLAGNGCDATMHCGADMWLQNGAAVVNYERLNTSSAGDRNRGIKWVPKDATENTPFGGTLYFGATWTIPSMTSAARAKVDSAAAALGLQPQTDTAYEMLQRKLIYVNPGRTNWIFAKIHGLSLAVFPGVAGGAPCSPSPSHPGFTVYKFKDTELFDKPHRIEFELKRSSGVRVADAEVKVWVDGVMVKHVTGFCTNEDTNTSWQVQIGQQSSHTPGAGELYSEQRIVDDLIVGTKRPF